VQRVWEEDGCKSALAFIQLARQLERELAEARKDAERYRWLRECRGPVAAGVERVPDGVQWLDTTDLDAAIDAARRKHG
jgi:hypothetical protein